MRVLLVNKFHYLKGGSEKYYFELGDLLKQHGHEIAFFSMKSDKNIKTNEKEYFVDEIDLNNGSKLKAFDVIYSKENKRKMLQAIEDFKPDIVHISNFQRQLSASIIDAIKEKNIPIIFTAHDLQAICPDKTMLDKEKEICEKCIGGHYINCIKNKCVKNSILKSVLGAIEGEYYRVNEFYTKKIDFIITPSEFYRQKLIEDGISGEKIQSMHNFVNLNEYDISREDKGYAFYFGRLSKEKGILNLLEAFRRLEGGMLYIAGEGPERKKIEEIIERDKLQERVKLLGFLNSNKIKEYVANARFIVVPSIWYENCPYSVMETLAIGKPVIGAKIAGIPELVKDEQNGLLYNYNDVDELSRKMSRLYKNVDLAEKLGDNAKKMAQKLYSKEIYYNKVNQIYTKIIEEKRSV